MLFRKKGRGKILALAVIFAFLFQCIGMVAPGPASAATTDLTITKYAVDGKTILAQKKVDYHWLMNPDNIPVLGDGVTRYYHQGPVFIDDSDPDEQARLRWNKAEDQNWDTKDMGALKGNNVKDLCKLVGDMAEGDILQVKAQDGMKKNFAYKNVYQYDESREGPMVICWYKDGEYPDTGYSEGMRLVWFAGATYKEGPFSEGLSPGYYHVFGNWDWHEAADPEYWYYFNGEYPTTTGLSVQKVSELNIYSTEPVPNFDILFDGTVALDPEETFTVTVKGNDYTINGNTPLGALQAAADASGFTYALSDKRWSYDGVLLLDDVGDYLRKSPGDWYAYVNDVFKDGYQNTEAGLNVIELTNGDRVEFYYAEGISDSTDINAVKAAATAAVKTVVSLSATSAMDVLFDGTVALDPEETFTVTIGDKQFTISQNTPLGALHAAAIANGFTYRASDKKWDNEVLLLDDIGDYPYVKKGSQWLAYVNDVFKDGFAAAEDALNIVELFEGDRVEFYYAAGIEDSTDINAVKAAATAAVKTIAATGVAPTEWTLQLTGARDENVTRDYFERGLACASSSHQASWTDGEGNIWGGVPLWLLVGMVDDNPDIGDKHYNFNAELAAQDYEIKVIAGDGWSTTLSSKDIANSDAFIIANTLNSEPLPMKTDAGKGCWPLHLKGSAIAGGQQVGNIVRIELSGLPEPPAGWTLDLIGDIGDTITQAEFEDALTCTTGHYKEWTDNEGQVWSGVPLWVLLGLVDDIEKGSHWTFDESLAAGYTVKVSAGDGFSKTLRGADVAKSDDYIVANKCNGEPLTGNSAPLRLVGNGVAKADGSLGGTAVGNIAKIEIPELQTPEPVEGSWNLALNGKITDVISQAEFAAGALCHKAEWTDGNGDKWSGIPLWYLAGWVDDRLPHNYDPIQALAGYKIVVKAADGYSYDFDSKKINKNNDYIIADKCNGEELTGSWPLRLVGPGVAREDGTLGGTSIGSVVEIKLTSFESGGSGTIPELHIMKYGEDGTTIIAEKTINYLEMQEKYDVIGDGKIVYKYQGITFNPDDRWDENENFTESKIANAIMGTRIKDLCDDLVGGMGAGTNIVFVAKDGWETTLPYSSIYPDPSVQERQGDAVLAWYADGEYVPDYKDGMRLFFTPEDHFYGQWDMHETLPEDYWHYYGAEGDMYPSCAGLSAKYITGIRVYTVPEGDWDLKLDGRDIGGLDIDVSKTYFESALTCTFGANHKTTYTDSKGREWGGMPLWLLVGFVDDQDQHSGNAFNEELAQTGYQIVITAADGHSVTIDSTEIDRNHNYIVANTLDGVNIPETDNSWPLRLVGPSVSGKLSIGNIASIELVPYAADKPIYTVSPVASSVYTAGTTADGIKTMIVNQGVSGLKYFTVDVTPVATHPGKETTVFTHLRNGAQLGLNATRTDFDVVTAAQAGFNVQAGDIIKAYIVDELTNDLDVNPIVFH